MAPDVSVTTKSLQKLEAHMTLDRASLYRLHPPRQHITFLYGTKGHVPFAYQRVLSHLEGGSPTLWGARGTLHEYLRGP